MNNIWTIIKKELKKYFTDKRMLISLFLPGILIFCMYTIMGNVISNQVNKEYTEFNISIINEPNEFKTFFNNDKWEVHYNNDLSLEEGKNKLSSKELDLYVVYDEDFYNKMLSYDVSSGLKAPQVEIYYNSANEVSSYIYNIYKTYLNSFESAMFNKFDVNGDENIKYDVDNQEDTSVQIISSLVPFLLITFLFTGAMSICSESIAGEKERGTIATLLITPTKRSEIAIGKITSLAITGLVSALISFLGLILSLPKLMGSDTISLSAYNFTSVIAIFGIIVVTVLLFTTILTLVSTYAKSVKEATSYSTPIMIIVMLIGLSNFMTNQSTTNSLLYLIPIYNSIQSLIEVFSLTINPLNYFITMISNIIYIFIGVYVLTRMFNDEKIMFN